MGPTAMFNTVQEDISFIYRLSGTPVPQDKEEAEKLAAKVRLAALRCIAAVGMVIGALVILYTLPSYFTYPLSSLFIMSTTAVCMLFERDIFIISKNATDQMSAWKAAGAATRSAFGYLQDLWEERKTSKDNPSHLLIENTLFRPLWDMGIDYLIKKGQKQAAQKQ